MSRVIALIGATPASNVQVKQRAAKLNVVFRTWSPMATVQALYVVLNAIQLKVDLQSSRGGSQNLIPSLPLGVLGDLYSAIEGYVSVRFVAASFYEVQFSIELSYRGALELDSDSSLVLSVVGMVVGEVASPNTLDIYATDFPQVSKKAIKINVLRFSNSAPQNVNLTEGAQLHLPVSQFQQIILNYGQGTAVTLSLDELKQWCLEGNNTMLAISGTEGSEYDYNGVIMGYRDYLSLNVVSALSAQITMGADINAYMFGQVDV